MIAYVVCVSALLEAVVGAELFGGLLHLAELVDVVPVRVAQPQVGGDCVFGLVVLTRAVAVLLQQDRGLHLKLVHALVVVPALVEERDEHRAHLFRRGLSEAPDHPRRKVVHRCQEVIGLGQRPLEHVGEVGRVHVPVVLEVLHGLPLVLLVAPLLWDEVLLVLYEHFLQAKTVEHGKLLTRF